MPEAPLDRLRAQCWSSTGDLLYFNSAAHGLLPDCARIAVEQYLTDLQHGASEQEFSPAVERLRTNLAQWVGCADADLAFCQNVSAGLNIILRGFAWEPGRHILLCPEIEHPTLIWAARALDPLGVKVRTVPAPRGQVLAEDVVAAMSDETQMVALSAVSYLSGGRIDLAKVGAACRQRHVFFLVDAAQSVGFARINMKEQFIDGLVANVHKGLLGLAGLGFLGVNRQWLPHIRPLVVGQESVDSRQEPWQWADSARRFEVGHRNSVAAVATLASLELLGSVGIDAIERHIVNLRHYLVNCLMAENLRVLAPDADSHIVAIEPHQGSAAELVQALSARGVKAAARGQYVRFSLHAYNVYDDVDRLLDIVRRDNLR